MPTFEIQTPDGSVYQIDGDSEQGALAALKSHLATQNGFAQQAAQMDPTSLSVARSKDDAFGDYLRNEAMKPRDGEAPEARDARLYGQPMQGPSKGESFVRGAADMASFGFGDEMAAGLEAATGGRGYAEALQRQRDSQDVAFKDNPWSYRGGELAGAVATSVPSVLAGGGPAAGGLLGQSAKGAGAGAVAGGTYGFGSGQDGIGNRLAGAGNGAVWGGLLGGAAPAIAKGIGATVGYFTKPKVSMPETAAIKAASQSAFKDVDQMGVAVSPQAYDSIVSQVENAVGKAGLFPKNHPELMNVISELDKYRGSPIPLTQLQSMREMIKSAYSTSNPSQNRLMNEAIDAFDSAIDNISPSNVINGNAPAAIDRLKTARAEWSKFRKAEKMDQMAGNAENALGANYTQAGFQTGLRQQLRALAKDDFKAAPYLSKAEREAVLKIVRGGVTENALRRLGQFSLFTTGGTMRSAGASVLANFIGGPPAAATVGGTLGALGTVARPISTHMGKKSLEALNALIRNGGQSSVASRYAAPAQRAAASLLQPMSTPLSGLLGSLLPVFPPSQGLLGGQYRPQ